MPRKTNLRDQDRVKDKFDSVWSNYLGKARHTMVIELMEDHDSVLKGAFSSNLRTHLKTQRGEKSNKCNQCEYTSSHASHLRRHLKMHSGEKSNKCNKCEFASSHTGHLKTHLKTQTGEKSNKCNQSDFSSSKAVNLRTHLKTHSG